MHKVVALKFKVSILCWTGHAFTSSSSKRAKKVLLLESKDESLNHLGTVTVKVLVSFDNSSKRDHPGKTGKYACVNIK